MEISAGYKFETGFHVKAGGIYSRISSCWVKLKPLLWTRALYKGTWQGRSTVSVLECVP